MSKREGGGGRGDSGGGWRQHRLAVADGSQPQMQCKSKWEQGDKSEARAMGGWEAGQGKKASGPRVPTPNLRQRKNCDGDDCRLMVNAPACTLQVQRPRELSRPVFVTPGNRPKSVFETGFLSPIRTISGLAGGTTTANHMPPPRGLDKDIEEARHDTQ